MYKTRGPASVLLPGSMQRHEQCQENHGQPCHGQPQGLGLLKALDIDKGQQPSVDVHQIRLGCHDLQDQGSAVCGQGMLPREAQWTSGSLWVMMPEAA